VPLYRSDNKSIIDFISHGLHPSDLYRFDSTMGRITIFSVEDCVHCDRLVGALTEQEVPFTEISLSSYPQRRPDMLALSDRLTVPQVFFNHKHIGGADDTFRVLEQWFADGTKTMKEHYQEEVGALSDPTDPRLQPSTEAPVEPAKPLSRPKTDFLKLPDGSCASVVTMVEKLKTILTCQAHKHKRAICKNSFTGEQAVEALQKDFQLASRNEAIQFGEYLRQSQLLHCLVDNRTEFSDSSKALYRLQCHQTPNILNSYRIWNTVVDPDYMAILKRLKSLLTTVEKQVTDSSTGGINYTLVHANKDFPIFEEAVCELQRVDLTKLDASKRKAFGINVYNLMISYGFMKIGVGCSSRSRSAFFNGVCFRIGSETFSFQDWEHGFLRSNRKAPYSLKHQFGRKDPRLGIVLPHVDCRIHFALNCGAKSCPPMRTFTADGIEEELRIVSQAFFEDDENAEVDLKRRTLHLNKILSWYRIDFAESEKELPNKVLEYLRGKKREQLQELLNDGKPITVSYKKYDWSTNASDFVPFDSAVLRADVQRLVSRFTLKRKKSNAGILFPLNSH
jgi:glutaredoxin